MTYSPTIGNFLEVYDWSGSPESLIKKLARDLANSASSDSTCVIQKLKIYSSFRGIMPDPHYVDMPDSHSGNILFLNNGRQIVQLNRKHSEQRQIFSWAHEICHSFFPNIQNISSSGVEDPFEDKLCDMGAAELLFSGIDLYKYNFDTSSLITIIKGSSTSHEAAAIYMVKSGIWPKCGMAVWKQKYRKTENPDQTVLFQELAPKPVFRSEYSIYPRGILIPKNKSVDGGNLIKTTFQNQKPSEGAIFLNLKPKVQIYMEAIPISGQRILSLIKSYQIVS